jgi:hypothetical protein
VCQSYTQGQRQVVHAALALTTSCKQIWQETRSTFYGANDLVVELGWYENDYGEIIRKKRYGIRKAFQVLRAWIDRLGDSSGLSRVTADFDTWQTCIHDEGGANGVHYVDEAERIAYILQYAHR